MVLRAAAGTVVLVMLVSGCAARHGQPLIGGSTVPNPTGTISGTVTAITGTPIEGRRVSAISMTNEAHYDATTAKNGGYTIQVPPGRYRLQVELLGGDQLAKGPGIMNVNVSDLDEMQDFVIGR